MSRPLYPLRHPTCLCCFVVFYGLETQQSTPMATPFFHFFLLFSSASNILRFTEVAAFTYSAFLEWVLIFSVEAILFRSHPCLPSWPTALAAAIDVNATIRSTFWLWQGVLLKPGVKLLLRISSARKIQY